MKALYIIGPFRAETEYKRRANIAMAEAYALAAWKKGWAVICPHLNTAHFDGECHDSVWLNGDIELLSRCDAVLTVHGYLTSSGSITEVETAHKLGLSIYNSLEDLPDAS